MIHACEEEKYERPSAMDGFRRGRDRPKKY